LLTESTFGCVLIIILQDYNGLLIIVFIAFMLFQYQQYQV